jgi:hypothetical protein
MYGMVGCTFRTTRNLNPAAVVCLLISLVLISK